MPWWGTSKAYDEDEAAAHLRPGLVSTGCPVVGDDGRGEPRILSTNQEYHFLSVVPLLLLIQNQVQLSRMPINDCKRSEMPGQASG